MARAFVALITGAAFITMLGAFESDPPTLDYTILMSGREKGAMQVRDEPGGVRRIAWSYNDRGRGPDLVETRIVDAKGIPTAVTVEGTDYRKHRIAERLTVTGSEARWASDADTGQGPSNGFYVPSQSNTEDLAAIARAALAAGGTINLLPSGRVRAERAAAKQILRAGKAVNVTLYLLHGLDLSPAGVWLDDRNELFAAGGAFLGTIRKGFEEEQPALLAAQAKIGEERLAGVVRTLERRPTAPVAFRHVRLFDAERRIVRPGMTVLIRGDRIVAVGSDASVRIPAGAEVIDGKGKTLLPGLWDMHVHLLDQADGLTQLFAGITTVRDLGNDDERVERIKGMYDRGVLPGPRVLKTLLIDGKGPLAAPLGVQADTAEEIGRWINGARGQGFAQAKLYSSLKPALVPAAVAAAHANGIRISGHVPAGMSMRDVVAGGYDEVHHAYFWLLNFMSPEVLARTNSPSRFTDAGEHGVEIKVDSAQVRDFVRYVAERGVVLDPTFVAFETMFMAEKGKLAPWLAPWAARMPIGELRGGRTGGRGTTPELKAKYNGSYERARQLLKQFWAAGVPIVPGTDGSALLYSRELENYSEAGIPNRDILYFATLGSARVMKRDLETGSIKAGKLADLVLIDGDPLTRISDIRRTDTVVKGGVFYDAERLARAIGLAPRKN